MDKAESSYEQFMGRISQSESAIDQKFEEILSELSEDEDFAEEMVHKEPHSAPLNFSLTEAKLISGDIDFMKNELKKSKKAADIVGIGFLEGKTEEETKKNDRIIWRRIIRAAGLETSQIKTIQRHGLPDKKPRRLIICLDSPSATMQLATSEQARTVLPSGAFFRLETDQEVIEQYHLHSKMFVFTKPMRD